MSNQLVMRPHDERGMTTAEYALGTIAVIALVAAVIAFVSGDAFDKHIANVVKQLIDWILTFIG
jgi:Flp pilus assembly pilin Flp